MPKILTTLLAITCIAVFLVSLIIIDFWLFLNGYTKLIYSTAVLLSVAIFLTCSYFAIKIRELKKENAGIRRLLEKNEKKFGCSERERHRILEAFWNLREGIIVIDESERISMANPGAKQILGIKSKEIKGLSAQELCSLPNLKPLLPYFISFSDIAKTEIKLNNLVIEVSVAQLFFSEKNMGRMITIKDKTQEVRLESDRTDFVLSAAHQIKTSVASAKWSLKMFLSGDFGKISKEQNNIIERLYKKNEDLIFLIDSLVEATKIESGAYVYNKTLVDVEKLVQGSVSLFQDKVKSKKVRVLIEKSSGQMPRIMLDKEKMEAVIQNLFDNALKYTSAGGSIKVSLGSDGKEIKFKISDSGIGIPKNQQPKIFSKFFRASNANKIEAGGSGIGLFIAKRIVEDHGGKIWFESEENKGSAFYFTIPVE